MPKNTYKSAAVPFVNQKGERSMKRVKVERYVAGKKPSYAKDDDDEEYYTTDEEEAEENLNEELSDNESEAAEEPRSPIPKPSSSTWLPPDEIEDDEEDDPRFRRLKQLDSKVGTRQLLDAQLNSHLTQSISGSGEKQAFNDEDEDEDEIRQRHALARARTLEEPIGPQAILGDLGENISDYKHDQDSSGINKTNKLQTEDILKDLKLSGIKPKKLTEDNSSSDKIKDIIENAKQKAIIKAQLLKKIEEDNRREQEKEALSKLDMGATDMYSAKTDDEDDDIAYEEWKLREIKRVARDRSERALECAK